MRRATVPRLPAPGGFRSPRGPRGPRLPLLVGGDWNHGLDYDFPWEVIIPTDELTP